MEVMQFIIGADVEVVYVVNDRVSGWVPATIKEVYESEYEVELKTQLEVNRSKLRIEACAFYYDFWIPGKVWEVHYHSRVGTKNDISYSVQAMEIQSSRLRRYSVSKSEIRVRRQWVDGEWVPLPQIHQVDPSIKDTGSSAGPSGHSSEQQRSTKDRSAALQCQLNDSQFRIGVTVEIFMAFMGGWKHATIKELQEDQIRVQYKAWSRIEDKTHEVDKFYDVSLVRPLPLQKEDEKLTFNLHQEVEVHQLEDHHTSGEGWYVGEVLEIYDDMFDINARFYTISHPKLGMINVKESCLRVHKEWDDGTWIQLGSASYMEQVMKKNKNKMEEVHSTGADVEVYSLYHKGWISGSILESVGNQVEIEMKLEKKRLYVDASRLRPQLSMQKDNSQLFVENEVVEAFEKNNCWIKGKIWQANDARGTFFILSRRMSMTT
ncbi:hypothetical protein NE237_001010 [Protea cynaroides]|uniref:Uncharacterized protein n=1 Tax=Protea cynaroides TaxID=273540 RepID=A0A9Q0KSP4_9MAGN|nr:hypothetical protein NE237_001010 [Protea cynaroides]